MLEKRRQVHSFPYICFMRCLRIVFPVFFLALSLMGCGPKEEPEPVPITEPVVEPVKEEDKKFFFSEPITKYLADHKNAMSGSVIPDIIQSDGSILEKNLGYLGQMSSLMINDPDNKYGITDIKELLSKMGKLSYLDIYGTGISDIDLSGKRRLNRIYCEGSTSLRSVNLSGCPVLKKVEIYGCSLETINLTGCPQMETLALGGNKITNLDIRPCENILSLSISEQKTSDPVRVSLTRLQKDKIDYNVPDGTVWDVEGAGDGVTVLTGEAKFITSVGAKVEVTIDGEAVTGGQRGLLLSSEETPNVSNSEVLTVSFTESSFTVELDHLVAGLTYYARGFIRYTLDGSERVQYGNIISFTLADYLRENRLSEYVDLGLSVLWARYDIGTSGGEEPCLFAWGEPYSKESFSQDNYSFSGDEGFDQVSDPAKVNWGGDWRLPTKEEFQELIDNCDFYLDDDYYKYKAVSRINGEVVYFYPFNRFSYQAWTSSSSGESAEAMMISKGEDAFSAVVKIAPALRYEGLVVHPVVSPPVNQELITFQDGIVKQLCVERWDTDGDGELSLSEAESVETVGNVFTGADIRFFDEFRFFTGIRELDPSAFSDCITLQRIILPEGLEKIGEEAFRDCWELGRLDLPSGINSLGARAFEQCRVLAHCDIPEGVTVLPDYLFYRCESLETVNVGKGVKSIGVSAFRGCVSLLGFDFPSGLQTIEEEAFVSCVKLERIMLPITVSSIGENAFGSCIGVKEVTLPDLEVVERLVFVSCKSLERVYMRGENTKVIGERAFLFCSNLKEVVFPPNLRSIGPEAFKLCGSLEKVAITSGALESIGKNAFMNCSGLKKVSLSGGSGDAVIGPNAFQECGSLASISIGEGFSSISDYVFLGCSALTEVSLPKSLLKLGPGTFFDCYSLKTVALPDNLKEIPLSLFEGCSSFSEVTLPKNLTKIRAAFRGTSLTSITIPESVSTLDFEAFYGISSLLTIKFESPVPAYIHYEHQGGAVPQPLVDKNMPTKILVPKGSRGEYMKADYWDLLASILEEVKSQ